MPEAQVSKISHNESRVEVALVAKRPQPKQRTGCRENMPVAGGARDWSLAPIMTMPELRFHLLLTTELYYINSNGPKAETIEKDA
ncbi:hypothetical protein M5K25_022392 [Dendrobium thyrsiflorum]|uniref:Uncharacterized protein n=1 Tax=Dendrobium thyrsiflorum TaxID=117978 RepID=A0ABD0U672_DENTH